jgi:hypothetical protein
MHSALLSTNAGVFAGTRQGAVKHLRAKDDHLKDTKVHDKIN